MQDTLTDRLAKQKTAGDSSKQAYVQAMQERNAKIDAENLANRVPRATAFVTGLRTEIVRKQVGDPSKYVRIRADFVAFVKRGDSTQNVILQPGDYIIVPQTNTPDLNQINGIVNTIFVLDSLGGLLGFRFRR